MLLAFGPRAHAALSLSTDHRPLFFGSMELGEDKVLEQNGTYHNRVTCSSTNGQRWQLNISVLQPLSAGGETIPIEALQWQVASTTGRGALVHTSQFTSFRLSPELVYRSGADEAAGQPVDLDFRYRLEMPEEQVSGVYQTTIRFTLTEVF